MDSSSAATPLEQRMVHARTKDDREIVRYDRAGKWYEESAGRRRLITISLAVEAALLPGSRVNFGLPGGTSFDAKVRRRRGF